MGKISFEDITNKESKKIGIVCGTGGSLTEYLSTFEDLSKNEKDKYCFISCNDWNNILKIDVNYWVIANSVFTVENNYSLFNTYPDVTLVYSDSIDVTNRNFVAENLKINYLPYDERHNDGKPCTPPMGCCPHIDTSRRTIQEHLQYISGHDKQYASCGTVGIHMVALAVILGCNPIYVAGIDMNYSTGYANNTPVTTRHGEISEYYQEFGIQAGVISDSAKKLGIKIINLSKSATYGGLEKGEFVKL